MADADPLPSFPGWETIEKLGEGGMCLVFRVRAADGRGPERAIKVLGERSPSSVERFVAEAKLLQRMDHPNVLKVHDIQVDRGAPWIVMELLGGQDLDEMRIEQGAHDPEQTARWFADLAAGLATVHAAGIRHRDIKPANIMVGHDGIPRLIDFGIARDTGRAHQTGQGFVLGTAAYLPPEIFTDEDSRTIQDSEATDVYALGQSLCEVLTGTSAHPRSAEGNEATLLVRIMKDKVEREHLDPRQWRPGVPDGLATVVMAATAREPAARTKTAKDLEQALRGWLASRAVAEAAPITRVDMSSLPVPASSDPSPSPRPPPPSPAVPAAPSGPGKGVRVVQGAAGAAGFLGLAGLASVLVVVLVVGLTLLWAWRPQGTAGPADVVYAVRHDMSECRGTSTGRVVMELTLDDGHIERAEVRSSPFDGEANQCIAKAVQTVEWPVAADGVVIVTLEFR